MDEASSPTDISSSLSEFVRKEKLLKELYQDNAKTVKPLEVDRLKYNDEEIDGILQQMGRLLSPAGDEANNSVYKHVIEETENKTIEQILSEAKELVREVTPHYENTSPCFSTDDLSSEYTENEITFINVKNSSDDENTDVNGNQADNSDEDEIKTKMNNRKKLNNSENWKGNFMSKNLHDSKKKSFNILQNLIPSKKNKNKNEHATGDVEFLKQEVNRFNQLYITSKEECTNLKKELSNLQLGVVLAACDRIMSILRLAFFCAFAVTYAIPTTENDISTFTPAVTEKLDDSSKITTFMPSLSATKAPVINEKKSSRYDGDQVLRVFTVNSKHRKKIKEIERENKGQKWASNTTSVDMYIKKDKIDEVKQSLNNASMDFRILVENVQQAIDEENPPLRSEELNEFTTRKGHRLTFEHYHRMADVHGFLDYLASARSNVVSVHSIGESVEGRAIKLIKISSGKPNASAFWIDGGIHAREWITVASVSYLVNELVENRDTLDKELLETDFYIVPLLNPDGYEYSHESERLWRKNRRRNFGGFCVGTDLNRNWDYEWGGQGSSKFPCQEIYAGTGPLSEPETKSIADYILSSPSKFKAFVTFHSYGQYILYPWGYAKRLPSDAEDLDRVGRIAAAAMKQAGGSSYSVGNSAALLYAASGGADDWAKGSAKIKYSYTIELRDTGRHGFLLPASHIKSSGKEAFAAVKAIAKEMNT